MGCKGTGIFIAKCRVRGCYDGSFKVSLYNSKRKLIEVRETDRTGNAKFHIPYLGKYSVCASACGLNPKSICSCVYICSHKCSCKYFIFNVFEPQPHFVKVTLNLKDAHYCNFPISQGVINLWHK